jgi:hypothetical protein
MDSLNDLAGHFGATFVPYGAIKDKKEEELDTRVELSLQAADAAALLVGIAVFGELGEVLDRHPTDDDGTVALWQAIYVISLTTLLAIILQFSIKFYVHSLLLKFDQVQPRTVAKIETMNHLLAPLYSVSWYLYAISWLFFAIYPLKVLNSYIQVYGGDQPMGFIYGGILTVMSVFVLSSVWLLYGYGRDVNVVNRMSTSGPTPGSSAL